MLDLDFIFGDQPAVTMIAAQIEADEEADAERAAIIAIEAEADAAIKFLAVGTARPCGACGLAIGWRLANGDTICAECHERPDGAVKVLIVDLPGGPTWKDYAIELAKHRARLAGDDVALVEVVEDCDGDLWESAEPWTDATATCPKCGTAATWLDPLDHVRCMKCEPPMLAERTLAKADIIRERSRIGAVA